MLTIDSLAAARALAIPVKLKARSFIFPVPEGIGSFMAYPEDVVDNPALKKGMPILSNDGTPKGRGLVFTNYTDHAFQAVRANGEEAIVLNGLSIKEAARLFRYYQRCVTHPEKATEAQIRQILNYAHTLLHIDDCFDEEKKRIPKFTAKKLYKDNPACGIFIRRNDDERSAVRMIGSGSYAGPASSPQRFQNEAILLSMLRILG